MRSSPSVLFVVLVGCAAGPRPVPSEATPAERLTLCETATLGAKAVASFEIDAQGVHQARFTGTLELTGSNALQLGAEGKFDREDVRVDLESMRGDINRSVTRGASVNSHHLAPAPALGEAVVVGLVRMGLLHNLVRLALDADVSNAEGGLREELKVDNVRAVGVEEVDGEKCHRVDYSLQVGPVKGDATLCIADATALPLQRRLVAHFAEGDLTATEHFKWKLK